MAGGTRTVERMLQDIEHRVLEEVWLGRGRSIMGCALVVMLSATTVLWWIDATDDSSHRVPTITTVMLLVASAASGLALALRRYRWCCAAAYCCGLASVFGIGALWWLRTGRPGAPLTWLVLADIAIVVLTILWLTLIITPIQCSQPDMRTPRVLRSHHGRIG